MRRFKDVFAEDDGVGMFPRGVGTTSLDVVRRIEEYSRRDLTNPSDVLKGMLGIFNAFERSPLDIYHCSGVPMLPSMLEKAGPMTEEWTPAMGFFTGLCWNLQERSARRPGFPS
jgi:hypothetical protein